RRSEYRRGGVPQPCCRRPRGRGRRQHCRPGGRRTGAGPLRADADRPPPAPQPRRAYGLPLRVRGDDGGEEERYAIVRSVAVTAPIEALEADERHRLGILFLLEPEADLALVPQALPM